MSYFYLYTSMLNYCYFSFNYDKQANTSIYKEHLFIQLGYGFQIMSIFLNCFPNKQANTSIYKEHLFIQLGYGFQIMSIFLNCFPNKQANTSIYKEHLFIQLGYGFQIMSIFLNCFPILWYHNHVIFSSSFIYFTFRM